MLLTPRNAPSDAISNMLAIYSAHVVYVSEINSNGDFKCWKKKRKEKNKALDEDGEKGWKKKRKGGKKAEKPLF